MSQCRFSKSVVNKYIHFEQSSDHFFSWSDDLIIRAPFDKYRIIAKLGTVAL
jgi:hypothetical protein